MVWGALIILILLLLAFDMLVLHKKGEAPSNKKVAKESAFWVGIALAFSGVVYWLYNDGLILNMDGYTPAKATELYITGYLIELSLSVDNLFVIAMIFASFKIPVKHQHKALFWGILGAIIFRGIAIGVGVVLIRKLDWMTYVFGAFLMFTALKMFFQKNDDEEEKAEDSKIFKFLKKIFKFSEDLDGDKFWTIQNGIRLATPLFAALIIIEVSDLLFALDSIPAILGVTQDPFIVFSSNIFAILGLRSMYFFLANMLEKFEYLEYSVFIILMFVGIKLMLVHHFEIAEWISLTVITVSLLGGVLFSIYKMKSEEA